MNNSNIPNLVNYIKYGKLMVKLLPKIEEISVGKSRTNTLKLIQNILMITDIFLNHKRVNTVKMASQENF